MAELRAQCGIPIAAGESEATRFAFRELAMLRAADILQPDLGFCGGISEAMRIAALASSFNLRVSPHLWAGRPPSLRSSCLCRRCVSFIVEYSLGANPMLHDLIQETVDLREGMIAIPDTPVLEYPFRKVSETHAMTGDDLSRPSGRSCHHLFATSPRNGPDIVRARTGRALLGEPGANSGGAGDPGGDAHCRAARQVRYLSDSQAGERRCARPVCQAGPPVDPVRSTRSSSSARSMRSRPPNPHPAAPPRRL